MEDMRLQAKSLEFAMERLTPEERLVIQMLVFQPRKENLRQLCGLLDLEKSTVYRRRARALEKLEQVLRAETDR